MIVFNTRHDGSSYTRPHHIVSGCPKQRKCCHYVLSRTVRVAVCQSPAKGPVGGTISPLDDLGSGERPIATLTHIVAPVAV